MCLPSYVPHAGTVLSKHGVGVEPLFCLGFWDRGRACARGGGAVLLGGGAPTHPLTPPPRASPLTPPPNEKGKGRGEGRLGQGGRGRSKGGEKPMGTTACGGKGSKGRAANGDRPVGAASCRPDHHTMASCQIPPLGPRPSPPSGLAPPPPSGLAPPPPSPTKWNSGRSSPRPPGFLTGCPCRASPRSSDGTLCSGDPR